MIVVELDFSSDPRRLEARPAHRVRLERLHSEGKLVMAGPWDDDSGALLVFDVNPADLDELLAADPYFTTPGVLVLSRRMWDPLSFS
jgi:uncharacterized protein YciI